MLFPCRPQHSNKNMFENKHIYKQKEGLVWREVDDGVVIVSPTGGEVRALNKIGSTIWLALDGSKTAGVIIESLQQQYPTISVEQLQADFSIFVESLLSREMLTEIEPQSI